MIHNSIYFKPQNTTTATPTLMMHTNKPIVITINSASTDKNAAIESMIAALQDFGDKVLFYRHAEHLNVDTPNKDSYELFESGLDFAMLVTDKHRYLKSRNDITEYFPITDDINWVIQETAIHPHDICLTIHSTAIITDTGEQFSTSEIGHFVEWLHNGKK
ncbi:MAG: hypothetical protein KGV50_02065 [Gammaproteobacteria bacterium]|nr:hypothetical protein [Gammaproteobacteria bacterium]